METTDDHEHVGGGRSTPASRGNGYGACNSGARIEGVTGSKNAEEMRMAIQVPPSICTIRKGSRGSAFLDRGGEHALSAPAPRPEVVPIASR